MQPNLYDLSLEELEALMATWGEPTYRASQVWTWLYQHLATDVHEMTSLPKSLREHLEQETRLEVPSVLAQQTSLDGATRKDLLELADGERIEVVLMHYIDRHTACISSQVGCSLACEFCATGQMGFERNLSSGEIVAQVLHVARVLEAEGEQLTNVVLMGMGEPFLNYDNVMSAIQRLHDPDGFNMGQRRFTISTAGIVPGMRRFTDEDTQINLSVSLHAATNALRRQLMPINQRYSLDDVLLAVQDYIEATNRRVTFEWVLIHEVNDTVQQAEALAARIKGMLVHVNLIPMNPTTAYDARPSHQEHIEAFTEVLERYHISYTMRLRRGIDIQAGCGQLRQREGR